MTVSASSARRRLSWRRIGAVWPGLAAVLIMLGMFSAPPQSGVGSPGGVVSRYLAAIRAGDVTGALRMVGGAPEGESARFLSALPEQHWTVGSLSVSNDPDSAGAEVLVELVDGDRTASGKFRVARSAGQWRIADPFVSIGFTRSPLWYTSVDQVDGPWEESTPNQRYLVLPGSHVFYPGVPDTVTARPLSALLLPGDGTHIVDVGEVSLTEAGTEAATTAVRDYVDVCAETADDFWVDYCPFSTTGNVDARTEYAFLDNPLDITWTVVDYPTMSFTAGSDAFDVADEEPGVITVSGDAVEKEWRDHEIVSAGHRVDFAVDCQIQSRWLRFGVLPDGEFVVRHVAGRFGDGDWHPGDFPDSTPDTCLG